jgi:hypothetical protein
MTKIIETPASIYIQGQNGAADIEIPAYFCDYTICKIIVTPFQVGKKFYFLAQAISLKTGYVMHTALRQIDFNLPFSATASWVAAQCFGEVAESHSDGLWIEHTWEKKNGRR